MSTKIVIDGEMVEIGGGGSTVEGGGLSIRVHAPTGSTVTAEKDGQTYTTSEQSGVWDIPVPEYGVYTVKATRNAGEVVEGLVNANQPEVDLAYGALIYGVMWDSSNPSTALTRLTKFNDPNHLVNTNITEEPVAAVGTEMGSSPFDNCYPWSGMEEWNIVDNVLIYKKDRDSGFSRALYDTVVSIPKFWYHVIYDGTKWYWYIADRETDGFEKHPGSGRYVGKYITGNGYFSKTDQTMIGSVTLATARTESHKKGDNWYLYDYATWCAIWLLYLVEFADWNSQSKIGDGHFTADMITGKTDPMIYSTGTMGNNMTIQYRGIEQLWGYVYTFVDGINISSRTPYISLSNQNFQSDVFSGDYIRISSRLPDKGYLTNIYYSTEFPWVFFPTASGGTSMTYIPDYIFSQSSTTIWLTGSTNKDWNGLFAIAADLSSTATMAHLSSRLIYIPKEE